MDWFKNLPNKRQCNFFQFDVEKFYQSMSSNLFNEGIQNVSTISDSNKPIIKHLSKMMLFHNSQLWERKSRDPHFDVAMGYCNRAELCELERIFILIKLSNIIDKPSIDLYRDGGLAMFEKLIGPQIEQRKKKIIKSFKERGLAITVTSNITSVDFFDVTLNLKTVFYHWLRKPKNDPKNIDINSNLIPQNLKQKVIKKFLNKNGFNENLTYHQDSGNSNQMKKVEKRQCKII